MGTTQPYEEGPKRSRGKSPYFMRPGKGGAVTVYRRPAGNRAQPKLCGTMPSQAMARALVAQLQRAESVVSDLFLEATDDGIEALEAILTACNESVMARGDIPARNPRGRRRRRSGRRGRDAAAGRGAGRGDGAEASDDVDASEMSARERSDDQ